MKKSQKLGIWIGVLNIFVIILTIAKTFARHHEKEEAKALNGPTNNIPQN